MRAVSILGARAAICSCYSRCLRTQGAFHETLEVTHGFTPWFETGFYLFTSIQPDAGWEWVGDHIRPRVRVPVRYPAGSNGGVHRGPDKFPRRNAIRAVFLHAMAQDQEREHIDPSTGEPERGADGKPVKRRTKFAMVQDIVMAYQLIARHASEGKDLDQFLRMMTDAHNMLQPEKDEAGQGQAPIIPRFVYADREPEVAEGDRATTTAASVSPRAPFPPKPQPTPAPPSGGRVVIDGQVYV